MLRPRVKMMLEFLQAEGQQAQRRDRPRFAFYFEHSPIGRNVRVEIAVPPYGHWTPIWSLCLRGQPLIGDLAPCCRGLAIAGSLELRDF